MAEKEVKGIKKFFEEFKAFAMRGNVLDMAVGVVIGGAFTAIVNSLVNDIINPAIGLFFNADFSDVGIHVGDLHQGGALPPLHQQAGGLPGDQQLNFEWPPLCSGHIQRNHFPNYKSGKSADFPDLFFHRRSRKGKQHNQRKTSLPGRSRCGSRAGRFYFIREKCGKSVW